jgi:hypothetical protein
MSTDQYDQTNDTDHGEAHHRIRTITRITANGHSHGVGTDEREASPKYVL